MKRACQVFFCAIAIFGGCGKDATVNGRDAAAGGTGGGAAGSGGQAGAGVASGGATATGGAPASGGAIATGGGTAASGGAAVTGGAPASGGTIGSGGAPAQTDGGADAGARDAGGGAAGGAGGPVTASRCPAGPFPMPMVQSTKTVCAGFAFNNPFSEGPTWVAGQHAFFFTNFIMRRAMGGDIVKYTPGGQCEIFIRDVGCNGLAVALDGNLLAACHQSRSVVHFDLTTKAPTTVVDRYMGMMLDTPNDLIVHSNGTIYFTNPNFELDGRPAGVGLSVFRIDPAGVMSLIMQTPCNGIGLSPDEKKLYVFQAGVWNLDAQGVPSGRTAITVNGDGMAIDCAGNLYSSNGTIYNPQGQNIGTFMGGTNLAFGGPDGKTLLVVGGVTVREIQMNIPGLP
ncbi:MAG: SMP-30/gluconolactonase/LRE family protein [Pseudomonadota bacterium]